MTHYPLAVQMYTLRDYTRTARDFRDSLGKIHSMGYRAAQLSAVGAIDGPAPELTPQQCRELLDEFEIKCIATHRSWERLSIHIEDEIELHHTLGCNYTAIGGLPGTYEQDGEEGYRRFLHDSAPVIQKLADAGIRFGYHNHSHEFVRIGTEQRTRYDIFLEEAPQLMLEIDVYWAIHAGINPERLIEAAAGRVPVIHIKDKEVVPKDGPVMAAIGEGNMDWKHLLPACAKAGVEWYAVEQDVCRRDPFDCLRSSYNFVTRLEVS